MLIQRVPFRDYCKIKAVNWSSLKRMDESAKAYRWHQDNPEDHDTDSMRTGRAVHTLALDPSMFDDMYAVFEGDRRAGKVWTEFAEANAAREIIKASELEKARAIAEAVRECAALASFRAGASYEVTGTWIDSTTGLDCKLRADWLAPGLLIDLKTSRSINALRFTTQAEQLGYFGQLAHYRAGLEANGHKVDRVLMVVVENKPPYDVVVFEPTPAALSTAAGEVRDLMARLLECQKTNRWPGKYEDIQPLARPDWALGGELTFTFDED